MFTDPLKNLKALGLREDDIVVDLGAGTGYYTLIAGALVPRGKVYAVEIEKDFLKTIQNKVRDAHLSNVECLWGNVEKAGGTKIGDGIADAVIASNILFQVTDKDSFLKEVKRILKPKGKVLLIDWSEASIMAQANIISQKTSEELFKQAGFVSERVIDAGAHHYGIIFVKGS